ncbi:outer membrane beta-barrel family protein [Flavobacterium sp. JP2137]|uniref:outer membrane beta-barrel family protein n=1 Tax=Flavobacterium sp. JP2137 TaxID=3414510 RepID=UPI003D3001DB
MKGNRLAILIIVIIGIKVSAMAQVLEFDKTQFTIEAKVFNSAQRPIEFVQAYLRQNDSIVTASAITDETGFFSLTADGGTYDLILVNFGTVLFQRTIELKHNEDLGHLEIDEITSLEGIQIEARKKLIEQKVDRLVFNVEHSSFGIGGDALDILKVTPRVQVKNEELAMIGKSGVRVMVDHRMLTLTGDHLINFLKTIPSDNIKSIEVMTLPPAKYEAAGNSGIIHIKLKSIANDSWNSSIGTSYIQQTYPGVTSLVTFNFNKKRFSTQNSVFLGETAKLITDTGKIYYKDETWHNVEPRKVEQAFLSFKTGFDYKLSKNWTTGIQYLGSYYDLDINENSETKRFNNVTNAVNSTINSAANSQNPVNLNAVNGHSTYAVDTLGTNISLNFDYFSYKSDNQRDYKGSERNENGEFLSGTDFAGINVNKKDIANYNLKIDVELPIPWMPLNFGVRGFETKTTNKISFMDKRTGIPLIDLTQSNVFEFTEKNQAIYISGNKEVEEKWEFQWGMRMEATQTKGLSYQNDEIHKNQYVKFFPTAYISYTANENQEWSLSYSKRINRPNYEQLNPFVIEINPFNRVAGNPFLQPSLSDNIEFSNTFKSKWESSLSASKTTNNFQQVTLIDAERNTTNVIPLNYVDEYTIGFSESYTFNRWNWCTSHSSIDVNYNKSNRLLLICRR